MKRMIVLCFVFVILGLFISPKDINYIKKEVSKDIDETFPTDARQKGDFKVSISVNTEKKPEVKAIITYVGKEEKIDAEHGMNIFLFSIKQLDGDYNPSIMMPLPLRKTTLIKNKKHEETFDINSDELKPGTYEIKAIAGFSTEEEKAISIPVTKIIKITKEPKMQRNTAKLSDYQVGIYTNKGDIFDVKAKLTYYGKDDKVKINHGGQIFYLSVNQIDGDFKWRSGMDELLLETTLTKAISKEETFESYNGKSFYNLKPGTYEFKVIADFLVNGEKKEIPVSTIVKIEKEKE